jgi:hypothetical protein
MTVLERSLDAQPDELFEALLPDVTADMLGTYLMP